MNPLGHDQFRETERLIAAMLDGRLDAAQVRRLANSLRDGEVAKDFLLAQIQLHADLAWHALPPRPFSAEELLLACDREAAALSASGRIASEESLREREQPGDAPALQMLRSPRSLLAGAAVAAAAALWLFALWGGLSAGDSSLADVELPSHEPLAAERASPSTDGMPSNVPQEVAAIVDAVGTELEQRLAVPGKGSVSIGQTLEVESGFAELRFHYGARVVLTGPAQLKVLGPRTVRLDLGQIAVRMDEGVDGFVVRTPQGVIRDLGTAFGVEVGVESPAKLTVFEGVVDVTPAFNKQSAQRLTAGDSAQFGLRGPIERIAGNPRLRSVEEISTRLPDLSLTATRDAYVRGGNVAGFGEFRNFGDAEELLVKFDATSVNYNRRAWIGFDLRDLPRDQVLGARLKLSVVPNRVAETSVPDNVASDVAWTFDVYGLWDVFAGEWAERTINWRNAPGNEPDSISGLKKGPRAPTLLGAFVVKSRGVSGEKVTIAGPKLLDFLREDEDGRVTFIVSRRSGFVWGASNDKVVHGFASRENTEYQPPTLELWRTPSTSSNGSN